MTDSHGSPPEDEPKTPMWLPALGAALFVGVALWWAVTPSAPTIVADSDSASASVAAAAPTAPTALTGWGDGGGEAIISWNPSTSVNEPQSQIQYNTYIDGVLDSFDSTVGQTQGVYIFPRGADVPAQVWVVAVDQLGNTSARSNVLTVNSF